MTGRVTDYHINIFYSEEDGGHIADIPDLDSCSAFGRTAEEVSAEASLDSMPRWRVASAQDEREGTMFST